MTTHKDLSPFLYRLLPPRPSFAFDLTDDEMATMGQHAGYWYENHADALVAFGPVMDPNGSWGLAVVEATDADQVRAWADEDPAVAGGMCTYEVHPLGPSYVRPLVAPDA